ncbi:MAG: tol-pal system protein YbgF [Limibacillus sp.]
MTALAAPHRRPGGGIAAFFFAVLLAVALPAGGAKAQDLQSQIERLQRELSDLQSYVYRGGSGGASSGAAVQELPAGSAADIQVRLGELETSLRQLRGQIEEMNYRIRQNSDRLERFINDAEYRLTVLEGGDPVTPPPSASSAAPSASQDSASAAPQVQSQTQGSSGVSSSGVATGSSTVGSLGQVSENSLAAVQQQRSVSGDQSGSGQAAAESAPQTAAAPSSGPVTLPDGSPEDQYSFALGLLRQTRFDDAQVALDAFLEQNPNHDLAPNAKYWLGETYYVRADYQNAAVTFAEGFQQFPQGSKAPDHLLKLGMSLGQLGDKQNACATFAQLQQRFPNAPSNIQQKAQLERQRLGC